MISLMYTLSFSKILSNALPFLHILMMPSRFPHYFLSASCFVFPSSSFFLLAFCLHLFLLVLRFLFLLCLLLNFFFIRFSFFSFSSSFFPMFFASVFSYHSIRPSFPPADCLMAFLFGGRLHPSSVHRIVVGRRSRRLSGDRLCL